MVDFDGHFSLVTSPLEFFPSAGPLRHLSSQVGEKRCKSKSHADLADEESLGGCLGWRWFLHEGDSIEVGWSAMFMGVGPILPKLDGYR